MTSAKAWGIEAHLLTPAEVKELVPFINEDVILGGFHCPTVSVVDSLETGTVMRKEAIEKADLPGVRQHRGARYRSPRTDPNTRKCRTVKAVVTDKGTHRGRVRGDRLRRMVESDRQHGGRPYIPLVPTVHQMADVGPIDVLAETNNEIGYPIVRDMDTFCYERQSAGSMEVGFLRTPADPASPRRDSRPTRRPRSRPPRCRSPPTISTTRWKTAIELMEMLGDAEIKYAINGLLSLTPDGMPCLGEIPEVRNLWSAAAVWVKEGPGMAQVVADVDDLRLPPRDRRPRRRHRPFLRRGKAATITSGPGPRRASTRPTASSIPPSSGSDRRFLVTSPYLSADTRQLDAEFFQARSWERPQWFGSNADLVERYGLSEREVEWDNRWWSPITTGEHLNLRENCGDGRPVRLPDL